MNRAIDDFEIEHPDEYYDDQSCESCPKCGRSYDDIEFDFQWCSKCGWNEAEQKWDEKREPSEEDFMNGDADILTGLFF